MAIVSQEGASSWLSSIPLKTYDFVLHKGAFLDAIALRYGWSPKDMPTKCECGRPFSVDHSLSCLKGGFPTLRRNVIRDLIASLLNDVCHDVRVEPHLQPLSGESMRYRTAKTDTEATSDISACGFGDHALRKSSWMCISSTQMLNHIEIAPLRPASDDMSRRKGVSMTNALGRSNMPPSPHSSSQRQEGWASQHQSFTRDLLT